MHADPKGVLTGIHFIDGDHAACEGALAAGCRFVAGYPITPSTEVVERFAARIPLVGGMFIQLEDELASSIAIQGAAWGGKKVMTVTSGPGLSLMMEHVGLAAITETPCVFVDVQRGGPSTGLPTLPAQADMMQVKWGSHGDYEPIALSPNSPQECFDLMIKAFNLAETLPRAGVLHDGRGRRPHDRARRDPARRPRSRSSSASGRRRSPGEYRPYETDDEPGPGDGQGRRRLPDPHHRPHPRRARLPGDERAPTQDKLVRRLVNKIRANADKIVDVREDGVDDADVVVVSFGITSRVAGAAVEAARAAGLKVGHLRLVITWPFPAQRIRELAATVKAFVVPELNMGQMALEVERAAAGKVPVLTLPHAGGTVHEPEAILAKIKEAAQ